MVGAKYSLLEVLDPLRLLCARLCGVLCCTSFSTTGWPNAHWARLLSVTTAASHFTNLRIDAVLGPSMSPSSSLRGPFPSLLTGFVCFLVFFCLSSRDPFWPCLLLPMSLSEPVVWLRV